MALKMERPDGEPASPRSLAPLPPVTTPPAAPAEAPPAAAAAPVAVTVPATPAAPAVTPVADQEAPVPVAGGSTDVNLTADDLAVWEALKDRLFDEDCTQISVLPLAPGSAVDYKVSVNVGTNNYDEPNIVFTSEESLNRVIQAFILPSSNIDMAPGEPLPPIAPGTFTFTEEWEGGVDVVRARIQIRTPPAAYRTGLIISKLPRTDFSLNDLISNGTADADVAYFLAGAVAARASMMLSGAPNAGKTVMLNALTFEIPATEKVAVLQDVDELPLAHVQTQDKLFTFRAHARSRDLVSDGSMSALIEDAKMSRPTRIITGELRDGAMLDHLEAASIFDGSLATMHANSAEQALDNMFQYVGKHPYAPKADARIWEMVAQGVDLIVHLGVVNSRRVVLEVAEVSDHITGNGKPAVTVLWRYNAAANTWDRDKRPSEKLLAGLMAANRRDTWNYPVAEG